MSIDKMQEKMREKIRANRAFMKSAFGENDPEFEDFKSDEELKKPFPPLNKAPAGGERVELPREWEAAIAQRDYTALLGSRRSVRAYADRAMTLEQLSFLLHATQGVQKVLGENRATLRPVPSGGARHAFETYIAALNVGGLRVGIYRYLPLEHALELVGEREGLGEAVSASLCGQSWAANAAAVFYYSAVPYRAEWRYADLSHKVMLLDAGHAMQNLYLSCEAVGCGCCAIAAFDQERSDALLGLDGQEEFTLYAAPVGVKKNAD